MKKLMTGIIFATGLAMPTPVEAHPPTPQANSSVQVRLVWVWVPAHYEGRVRIRGQWRHVPYGSHAHLRHRHHRPVVRHAPVRRGHRHPAPPRRR